MKLELIKYKIRQEIKKALLGKTEVGENIFVSRTTKFDHSELPAILIYPTGEKISKLDEAPKRYVRDFSCKIEIIGAAATDDELDLQLEKIGEQVEAIMELNETAKSSLGSLINALELTASDYAFEGESQTPIGSLILTYGIEFLKYGIPEGVELEDFKGVDIKYKLPTGNETPPDDNLVKAEDKVDLPQT